MCYTQPIRNIDSLKATDSDINVVFGSIFLEFMTHISNPKALHTHSEFSKELGKGLIFYINMSGSLILLVGLTIIMRSSSAIGVSIVTL